MPEIGVKVRLRFIFIFYCFLFLGFSCKKLKEYKSQPLPEHAKEKRGYFMNKLGDSIPTGIPIPIQSKRADKISFSPPQPVVLKTDPLPLDIPNNRTLADTTKKVLLEAPLVMHSTGEDGYTFPDTLLVVEKRVPFVQQQPFDAGPLQTRENVVASIQYLGLEEGLSSYYAHAILFDRRGHLWFGGENSSLNRYDGRTLTYFHLPEGFIKQNHWIRALLEDTNGNIWIGSDGGLARFDGQQITYYSDGKNNYSWRVNCLTQDAQGNIWIGTENSGLLFFDGKNFMHYGPQQGWNSQYGISAVLHSRKGYIWVGTKGDGLGRFEINEQGALVKILNYRKEIGLIHDNITAILHDRQGNTWIGTAGGGACRFNGETFTNFSATEGLCSNKVDCLFETRAGHLLFGNQNCALNWFDGKYIMNFSEQFGTNSVHAHSITEDEAGNIWVGTGEGIHRYGAVQFQHYKIEIAGTFCEPRAIGEDSQGELWFGVNCGAAGLDGLIRYDEEIFSLFSNREGLFLNNFTPSSFRDKRGKLWFGGFTEIIQIIKPDILQLKFVSNIPGRIENYRIEAILQSTQNEIWFGTSQGILIKRENHLSQITVQEGLPDNPINALAEDKAGRIWIGTPFALAYIAQDSITFYSTEEGLPHDDIRTMLVDHRGRLWAGTDGGVSYFDQGKFVNFTRKEGLVDKRIRSLIEDHQNRIWVGTQNGLSVMVPDKEFSNYKIYSFDKLDGLLQTDFNDNSVCLDSKNRLWWGKTKGAMMLDLNHFELPTLAPKIYLEHIEIEQEFIDYRRLADSVYANTLSFGQSLTGAFDSIAAFFNYPARLKLPYYLNHLSFQFSSIDWAGPQKLKYSFKLEGLDKEWSLPQANPKIEYRNLPHGHYTLEVKAIGAARAWSEPFKYTFTIRPPWWFTWWAYSLYTITFLTLLTGLFLYQRRRYKLQARLQVEQERADRLQELDNFKSRFYTNITHEFRTPLTVIKGMTDQIGGHEKIKTLIQRNSERLLNMVNQLLDLSRLETNSLAVNWVQGDVIPYLQYLTESCHSLANDKQVNLAFFSKEDSLVMDYDETKLQHILINLLSNAIKFTPEYGSVKVTAAQVLDNDRPFLELIVSDTGKGIPKDKLPNIFNRFYQVDDSATRQGEGSGIGLALVKELVQLLEGQIKVDSEENKGTTFLVMLPIRNEAVALHLQGEEQAARKGEQMTHSIKSTSALHPAPPGPLKGESARPNQPINPSTKPLILIIEDNADVTEYIISCLGQDYSLQTARNGKEGVEKALESVPDVILCDVMMPEMDGFEACRILKSERSTSHIPIILLTAKATQEDKVAGLSQGADAYLTKPFNKEELLVRLKNLAAISQRLRERLADATTGEEQASEQEQREAAFLQELHEIVETNIGDESFGTNRLCRAAAMSRTQLHRKLKALTGQATASFIRSIRLRKAKALLETTDLPIGDIAVQVGYKDFSHFSRSFGKEFGVLPSEVRK